jgi:hypothetical protein
LKVKNLNYSIMKTKKLSVNDFRLDNIPSYQLEKIFGGAGSGDPKTGPTSGTTSSPGNTTSTSTPPGDGSNPVIPPIFTPRNG